MDDEAETNPYLNPGEEGDKRECVCLGMHACHDVYGVGWGVCMCVCVCVCSGWVDVNKVKINNVYTCIMRW